MSKYEIPENSRYEYIEFKNYLEEKIAEFEWDDNVDNFDRAMIARLTCLTMSYKIFLITTGQQLSLAEYARYTIKMLEGNE